VLITQPVLSTAGCAGLRALHMQPVLVQAADRAPIKAGRPAWSMQLDHCKTNMEALIGTIVATVLAGLCTVDQSSHYE
jgi:hypothetical protein